MPTKVAFYYDTHKKNTKILSLKTAHTSACLVKNKAGAIMFSGSAIARQHLITFSAVPMVVNDILGAL